MKPGLYVVSTPIGNLGDISFRALETLKCCDVILAEDTRVTMKLLNHYGIHKKEMMIYNDQANDTTRLQILEMAKNKVVTLVSDAGTPMISDPGFKLVRSLKEEGVYITALPGASSCLTALCLSGMPSDHFEFYGFWKKEHIKSIRFNTVSIFFTPSRNLCNILSELSETGDYKVCVARELTKIFEDIRTGSPSELLSHYTNNEPRGEVVLLVMPLPSSDFDHSKMLNILDEMPFLLELRTKDICSFINKYHPEFVIARKDLYKIVESIKIERGKLSNLLG
jgi:16S rRNA (cytidine1402-2'-O)-methyltransferase